MFLGGGGGGGGGLNPPPPRNGLVAFEHNITGEYSVTTEPIGKTYESVRSDTKGYNLQPFRSVGPKWQNWSSELVVTVIHFASAILPVPTCAETEISADVPRHSNVCLRIFIKRKSTLESVCSNLYSVCFLHIHFPYFIEFNLTSVFKVQYAKRSVIWLCLYVDTRARECVKMLL
jgi:hypothetical protein